MNRLFDFLRLRIAAPLDATDRNLLGHFLATRDEAAFTELVRRHGPLVWGVCRRRFANHDAEDAFQATFLVLLRRAAELETDVPLGPWLHRVAVMIVQNIARGNRRRSALAGPLECEVASPHEGPPVERLDLDAALLSLPERDRAAIVLCHLQGLSRREAAARLGCPEGTLSARLSRALGRLREKFGSLPTVLAAAGITTVPAAISATTVRMGLIFTTSSLTTVGVSPAVAGLAEGVLRMVWMKKLMAGLALSALVASGLFVGLTVRLGNSALATDPVSNNPLVSEFQTPPDDPETAKRIVEARLKELTKKADEINQAITEAMAEKAKLEAALKKPQTGNAASLPPDKRIVAYIYDNMPVTREELADFLIARGGYEKLDQLVNKRIVEVEAAKRNITITESEVQGALERDIRDLGITLDDFTKKILPRYKKTLYEWTEDVIKPRLLLGKICQDRVKVTEDEVKKAFENKYGEKRQAKIICWNKNDKRVAEKQWKEARKSDADFDRLARNSDFPSLAALGGLVAPVGPHPDSGDETCTTELFKLKLGEVSELFETPRGFMCIKLIAIIPAESAVSYDKVHATLEREVYEKKLSAEIPKYFSELKLIAKPNLLLKGPPSRAGIQELPPVTALKP